MSLTKVGCFLVAVLVLGWGCSGEPPRKGRIADSIRVSQPLRTSICEVASHPAAFYDKTIVVHGCVSTDGIERNLMVDKACPHVGISVGESEKLLPVQRTILEGIARPGAGELCGVFSGTFRAETRVGSIVVNTDILEVDSLKTSTGVQ